MRSILFVCTGNICRSPMAETLFRALLQKKGLDSLYQVESAGTWAIDGQPASDGGLVAMRKRGLDSSGHRSRRVTRKMLESFDLILTMERGQKEALYVEFPYLSPRVFLLSEMVGEIKDVEDPIGGTNEEYEKTAQLLEDWLEKGLDRILERASRVRDLR